MKKIQKTLVSLGLGLTLAVSAGLAVTPQSAFAQSYTVQPGDTASSIAQHNGTTLSTLIKLNPQTHRLWAGEVINVPDAASNGTYAKKTIAQPTTGAVQTGSATAQKIIATGERYMGVPYVFGGHSPSGFDCQGFMRYIFGNYGVNLPSGARNQSTVGTAVSRDQLQPGDLVFFSTGATTKYPANSIKRIGHVGVYMGNGKVLHTYGSPGVTISNMNSGWWSNHYVTARRVLN